MSETGLDNSIIMETEIAVNTIIEHNYNKELENIEPVKEDNTSNNTNELKRKLDSDLESNMNKQAGNQDNCSSPVMKKIHIERLYNSNNKGPYEVVIQSKDKTKINPFQVGKILKNHNMDIDFICRAGKNISVTCKNYLAANNLVQSNHLPKFNIFIPSNKVHSIGVVYVEPGITEIEMINESNSKVPIISAQRIKRKTNNELRDTHFMKLTFDSDCLPNEITLNYVRMTVDPYIIPVKQCFRCFSYSHVASSPCNRNRLCRDCGEVYHSGECISMRCCIHCKGNHSSNSRQCPEYIRQKNIKTRMSLYKEDYFKASVAYPVTYNKKNFFKLAGNNLYSTATKINLEEFPDLKQPDRPYTRHSQQSVSNSILAQNNRYSPLSDVPEQSLDFIPYRRPGTYTHARARPNNNYTNDKPRTYPSQEAIPVRPNSIASTKDKTSHQKTPQDIEKLKKLIQIKLQEFKPNAPTAKQQFNAMEVEIMKIFELNTPSSTTSSYSTTLNKNSKSTDGTVNNKNNKVTVTKNINSKNNTK